MLHISGQRKDPGHLLQLLLGQKQITNCPISVEVLRQMTEKQMEFLFKWGSCSDGGIAARNHGLEDQIQRLEPILGMRD